MSPRWYYAPINYDLNLIMEGLSMLRRLADLALIISCMLLPPSVVQREPARPPVKPSEGQTKNPSPADIDRLIRSSA